MLRVLLTGFEPFGGNAVNASANVVRAMGAAKLPNVQIVSSILPVDIARAPGLLQRALATYRPDCCLMLGQADSREVVSVERLAVNLCDFRLPDNAGRQWVDQPVVLGGPAAYFTTLSDRVMLAALRNANVPAELSLSAGAYLCNAMFYSALHYNATRNLSTRCGFLHIPPEQQLALSTSVAAVTSVLAALSLPVRHEPLVLPLQAAALAV